MSGTGMVMRNSWLRVAKVEDLKDERDLVDAIEQEVWSFSSPEDIFTTLTAVGVQTNINISLVIIKTREPIEIKPTSRLVAMILKLREVRVLKDGEDKNPWFSFKMSGATQIRSSFVFNYKNDPGFSELGITKDDLLVDFVLFPRSIDSLPEWYKRSM